MVVYLFNRKHLTRSLLMAGNKLESQGWACRLLKGIHSLLPEDERIMKKITQLCSIFLVAMLLALPVQSFAVDRDGDGHDSVASGGDDCADRDANRYPGNVEVCDSRNHDEDCNPMTYGLRDEDKDGEVDSRCCNVSSGRGGARHCGTDCDDRKRAIQPASQVCDGERVAICGANGSYTRANCPSGTICVAQPNGTGVCMTRPAGYVAAPSFRATQPAPLPSLQQVAPQRSTTPAHAPAPVRK
jgi:hypothetical protein